MNNQDKKFLFVLVLLVLDRLFKWLVLRYPDFYSSQLFDLRLFKNTKLYFFSLNPLTLNILIGIVLFIFIILFLKNKELGLLFIVLGGLSNFFDRLFLGYVVDYLRIFILPISLFNIADLMVIFGIVLIIHRGWWQRRGHNDKIV